MELIVTTMVTTYNHERFIAQALDSAIAQRGDFTHEILVSDDASTDGTRQIIREYAQRYPNLIRDISNDENIGISRNMSKCFEMARGQYLAVLEGDDYWTDPEKLKKQLEFLEANADCSMVFSRVRFRRGEEFFLLPRQEALPEKIDCGTLVGSQDMNPICNFSCCLFRTKYMRVMPKVAYEHRLSEVTVAFYLVLLGRLGYIKDCLSVYRLHEHGVFAGQDERGKLLQALRTFLTVRKLADFGAWPYLTAFIEQIKRQYAEHCPNKVSVVTITYNNLAGLKCTAASVASQTWRDFEWIVIDGGSADGTKDFISQFTRKPDFWVSEKDGGIYDALNKGIAHARGEYVICMNAGDTFRESDTLKKIVNLNPTADIVYGDWVRKYPHHEEFCAASKELPPFYFFMPKCNICHQAMFVKTRLLQESPFDTNYYIAGDWAKWRQLMMDGCSFQYVPVTVCDFEAKEGVSSRQTYKNVLDGIRLQTEFPLGMLMEGLKLKCRLEQGEAFEAAHRGIKRLGEFWQGFLWFPRKVRGGILCLEQNGWAYTIRNIKGKIRASLFRLKSR